jgi:bisphosphoglycerate-independent phosphoglycerate mutase (AlkP superfamily)
LDKANESTLIRADHVKLACMRDIKTEQPHAQHTRNPVNVAFFGVTVKLLKLRE